MKKRKSGLAFHCHHNVLVEYVYDYDERVEFIKANKPEGERKLRLRLFRLIPNGLIPGKRGGLWKACDEARKACSEARKACYEARKACDEAWKACSEAEKAYYQKYGSQLEELHSKLCPNCPWNGKTIFRKEEE